MSAMLVSFASSYIHVLRVGTSTQGRTLGWFGGAEIIADIQKGTQGYLACWASILVASCVALAP